MKNKRLIGMLVMVLVFGMLFTGCEELLNLLIDDTYEIGDTGPAGGIIFYHDPNGFNVQGYGSPGDPGYFASYTAYFLEAAPANEANAQWGSQYLAISDVTTFTISSDVEASIIGNGRRDTSIIVNHLTIETGRAAQLCANKSLNGFNDWFLPSLGELNQLYLNRNTVNSAGGNLGTNFYWSSSQMAHEYAWSLYFLLGNRNGNNKVSENNTRAIRAF